MKKHIIILCLLFISGVALPGERDLTFVVWSDSHFGAYDYTDTTRLDIMDQISELYNADLPDCWEGERQGFSPDFLMHCGDITEKGTPAQWNDPNAPDQQSYVHTLRHLAPSIKPYAVLGNHDSRKTENVRKQFKGMFKGTYYSFECKGIHIIALDPYPEMNSAAPTLDSKQLAWLADDLAKVPADTPVIFVMHVLPIYDETIDRTSRLDRDSSEALAKVIAGKQVLAFLHGHWHRRSVKDWNGVAVIAPAGFAYWRKGCPNGEPMLGVVQVTDSAFSVFSYNWENRRYEEKVLYRKVFGPKPAGVQ